MTLVLKAGDQLIPFSEVYTVDNSEIEKGIATLHLWDRTQTRLTGTDALEAVMTLKPSALEGRRLRWLKNRWAFHNMVGHPVMQILAWLGFHNAAIRVHDRTVPFPVNHR